jgi:glucose-6-phosphate isomerase
MIILTTDFDQNMPVVLALLSIWYNNFFGAESEALIPYTQYLQNWLLIYSKEQWKVMVKLGRDGQPVDYETGTIIWENLELMHNMLFSN